MAVITQHAPRSMRQVVLQAAAQGAGVHSCFREIIFTCLRTDKHFTSDGHGGPKPMGVGVIAKGKKGKKGDGKRGDVKKGDGKKVDGNYFKINDQNKNLDLRGAHEKSLNEIRVLHSTISRRKIGRRSRYCSGTY